MSGLESFFGISEIPSRSDCCFIGEIAIRREDGGGFSFCHRDEADRDDLDCHFNADAASEIARYDDGGKYRPLKTAPNLRKGWKLVVASRDRAQLALDLFYPGRLAAFFAWERNELTTTPLRETLGRQTGMYRAVAKISDEQIDRLVGNFCRSDVGCLRTILWKRDVSGSVASTLLPAEKYDPAHDQTGRGKKTVPLLCQEACNLLVAEARKVVK